MTREEIIEILGENADANVVSSLLDMYHNTNKDSENTIAELNKTIKNLEENINSKSDYDAIKKQLDDINKANMSEQEKLEEMRKEVEMNLKESRITKNKAKALEILAGESIDEDILSSLVSENLDITISKATKMKETFNNLRETTSKKTKEDLLNIDAKPSIENKVQDGVMTWEKFQTLSSEEQNKFAEENPELFEKL